MGPYFSTCKCDVHSLLILEATGDVVCTALAFWQPRVRSPCEAPGDVVCAALASWHTPPGNASRAFARTSKYCGACLRTCGLL